MSSEAEETTDPTQETEAPKDAGAGEAVTTDKPRGPRPGDSSWLATDEPEEIPEPEEKEGPIPEVTNPRLGGWMLAVGIVISAACLIWLSLMAGAYAGDPLKMPRLWAPILLALAFQIGFVLSGCGLAALGKRLLYVYLPVVLGSYVVVGFLTGFIGYLVESGPDYKFLKPGKLEYGWKFEKDKGGLSHCSVTYVKDSSMPGRRSKSTMTVVAPRQRMVPMGSRAWGQLISSIKAQAKSKKDEGPMRRTKNESKELKINGQRAFKIVDEMSGPQGMTFTQAGYWWYSPRINRLMNCVVVLEGGGSWQLGDIEKMLNSIPRE